MRTPFSFRRLALVLSCVGVSACGRDSVGVEPPTVPSLADAKLEPLPRDQFDVTAANPPFYARVERPYVAPHDASTAVIVFYRSPTCVPPQFNLLDLFDVPAAFGCEMVTRGREYRAIGSDPFGPPYLSVLYHKGHVPVWFVSTAELMAAAADDVLTMDELRQLPSLAQAWAAPWSEWLEPFPVRSPSVTRMHARGVIPGAGPFSLDYEEVDFVITRFDLQTLPWPRTSTPAAPRP